MRAKDRWDHFCSRKVFEISKICAQITVEIELLFVLSAHKNKHLKKMLAKMNDFANKDAKELFSKKQSIEILYVIAVRKLRSRTPIFCNCDMLAAKRAKTIGAQTLTTNDTHKLYLHAIRNSLRK